ncbi:NAD dependent epimerase/dehydratase family [Verrucomicrobiia bacterium DG1235]|nr:NAD dependent epimerase/dehydratase family [Verrucomicrobiae bacterium DG1235]
MARSEAKHQLPVSRSEIDWFLSRPSEAVCDTLRNLEGDIVVLGAGGKMGLHLCLMLRTALDELEQSNRVFAVSRFGNLKSKSEYEDRGVKTVSGDLRDEAFVQGLPEANTVFYLVGAKFGTSETPDVLRETNVVLAERLAARYRNALIVAFSTGCVYSFVTPACGGSHEGSPTNPIGEYANSCLERERRFQEASSRYETPVVLIRLNYSVEFRYGVLVDIGSKVLAGEVVDVSTGFVNVIWQNDALSQIVQALVLAQSPAVPLNITGPEILSVREIAKEFGRRFSCEVRFEGEENETAWLNNAGRSHRLFGEPAVDVDTMIDWTAAWLGDGGKTYGKPTGFESRDGKF